MIWMFLAVGIAIGIVVTVIMEMFVFGKHNVGDLRVQRDTPESDPLLWLEIKSNGMDKINRLRYVSFYVVEERTKEQ